MKDRLSGQLDLTFLFDPGAAPLLIESLALNGEDVARDAGAVCAVIGSPTLKDKNAASASLPSGCATELLNAWRTSGVDIVSHIG